MGETARAMSVEEYLALDEASDLKNEFLSGVVVAMSGAAPRHNLIAANLIRALGNRLEGSPCVVLDQGQRVRIEATGSYVYPDVVVVCGAPKFSKERPASLLNPALVVEVLSPSTRDHDLGAKFSHYRKMPDAPELLFVEPDERLVSHYRRLEAGQWQITDVAEGEIELGALGIVLPLGKVYDRVDKFPPSSE